MPQLIGAHGKHAYKALLLHFYVVFYFNAVVKFSIRLYCTKITKWQLNYYLYIKSETVKQMNHRVYELH